MTNDAQELDLRPRHVALQWYVGRTPSFSVTAADDEGTAINLTSATASMMLKDGGGTTALTLATGGQGIVITDAAGGIMTISPEAVGTGSLSPDKTYKTDLKVTLGSGVVHVFFTGTVTLSDKVTT